MFFLAKPYKIRPFSKWQTRKNTSRMFDGNNISVGVFKARAISLQMNFELCRLANKKGPDEEEFTKLAGSLDEFIFCLFDPLKTGGRIRDVFLKASIDHVMDAAIEFKQMKVSGCH